MLSPQVLWAHEVKCNVGEGCLCSPSGGDVEIVNKLLNVLLDLFIGKVIRSDEWSEVGVEGTESLRSRPLVLEGAKKVHHLADGGSEMLWRRCFYLVGNTVESLAQ